jgi:VWFA-related protein
MAGGAQQTAPPAQPTFRAGVDVIQLDVSVLDKNRHPVHGLKAADFTVFENGKAQQIVTTAEVEAAENDPLPSAWMRHVPRDVASNDLVDELGDGRLFGIVLDDVNLPYDDVDIVMAARSVARYIVDQLGPSDQAAVVFPLDAGKTQDFTDDRVKLLAAIDRFAPREPEWVPGTPIGPGPGGGDMPQRFSPALARSRCFRIQPTVPALDIVVSRLASVPLRRKTLILVSTGVPVDLSATRDCPGELADGMREVFRKAERANVNIYGIDPAGLRGYEDYLAQRITKRGGAFGMAAQDQAHTATQLRHDFLKTTAESTGGRAVISDPIEPSVDQIFEEDGSYYLVGYQTSNGKPDGKFRRLEVKVNRPGVTVRTRSGYWAARDGTVAGLKESEAPTSSDLGLSGMMEPQALPLRASVVPIARAGSPAGRDAEVAVVLTARVPAQAAPKAETVTVIRNVYDADGRSGPPTREIVALALPPGASGDQRYDVTSRLTLAPGRYQIRLNAHSAILDKGGSVYADVEVPDFSQSALTLSGLELGVAPATARVDALASLMPIIPTTAREFSPSTPMAAFLRVFQGGASPIVAVTLGAQIVDVHDAVVFAASAVLPVEGFDATRAAGYQLDLPLARLSRGPYLLSITATLPGGRSVRRDLVFRVQ